MISGQLEYFSPSATPRTVPAIPMNKGTGKTAVNVQFSAEDSRSLVNVLSGLESPGNDKTSKTTIPLIT